MKGNLVKMMAVASLMASVSLLSSGCSKSTVETGEEVKPVTPPTESKVVVPPVDVGDDMGSEEPIESSPMGGDQAGAISEGRTNGPMLPVYFDFDKSNIRDDQQERIMGNADFMKSNPGVRISIEGNCDERGTNEYNMALGERRAQAAKKYLTNLGVSSSRMTTVSYGEEKPLLYGHDEYSWAQNRRDDFVIR